VLRFKRRLGQSITLQTDDPARDVFIRVASIQPGAVEIEIAAPRDVDIWRTELLRKIEAEEREEDAMKQEKTNGRA